MQVQYRVKQTGVKAETRRQHTRVILYERGEVEFTLLEEGDTPDVDCCLVALSRPCQTLTDLHTIYISNVAVLCTRTKFRNVMRTEILSLFLY